MNDTNLPNFQEEFAVLMNQLEVSAVGGDQASSVRPGGKSDQHIEMQITELFRSEAFVSMNLCQQLARFQPNLFRGSEDGMAPAENSHELAFSSFGRAAP